MQWLCQASAVSLLLVRHKGHKHTNSSAVSTILLACNSQQPRQMTCATANAPEILFCMGPHVACCAQDMTTLSYLNEPGVLWNLKARYQLDGIYTYTGSILIAVNPFASLPLLYGQHMMEQYKGRPLGELSPHVYAIADAAFKQMRKDNKSQSILVSCPD